MLRLLPVTALFDVQVIYMAEYSTRARPKPVCAPDGAWLSAVNGNDCLLNTAQQPSSARTPRARARTPHAAMMILDDRRSACVRVCRAALRELACEDSVCKVECALVLTKRGRDRHRTYSRGRALSSAWRAVPVRLCDASHGQRVCPFSLRFRFLLLCSPHVDADVACLACAQVLFLSGVAVTIGPRATLQFFTKRRNFRGSGAFLGGFVLVLVGWAVTGMAAQSYGFLLLFAGA